MALSQNNDKPVIKNEISNNFGEIQSKEFIYYTTVVSNSLICLIIISSLGFKNDIYISAFPFIYHLFVLYNKDNKNIQYFHFMVTVEIISYGYYLMWFIYSLFSTEELSLDKNKSQEIKIDNQIEGSNN